MTSNSSNENSYFFVKYTSEKWKELQSNHYELMQQYFMAINYTLDIVFPLKTIHVTDEEDLIEFYEKSDASSLTIHEKVLYKFIDIFALKKTIAAFNEVNSSFSDDFFSQVVKILFYLAFLVFFIPVSFAFLRLFQVKRVTLFFLEIHIKTMMSNLIIAYYRLKSTTDSNSNRSWLAKTTEDCKAFSNTFNPVVNSKFIFPLFSGLTALLPTIIKNTFIINIINHALKGFHISHILVQLLVLLFLYLPTIFILLIIINSYIAKTTIIKIFNLIELENNMYKKLLKNINVYKQEDKQLYSLIQIFFLTTLTMFLIPNLLDFSLVIKIPLILIILAGAILFQILKRYYT